MQFQRGRASFALAMIGLSGAVAFCGMASSKAAGQDDVLLECEFNKHGVEYYHRKNTFVISPGLKANGAVAMYMDNVFDRKSGLLRSLIE